MNPANEPAPAVHRTAGNGQPPARATAKYERLPLISLERALALGEGWSYAAPTLSGAGALALIVGIPDPVGRFLITLASLGLIASFGTLALGPFGVAARVGRGLFAFTLMVHTIEALYTAIRDWRLGLGAQSWFLRTVVLGSLALLALEIHIRSAPRLRSVR